uniref:Uncharacterized protein n=1 Tax=Timema poppense TaxID=170557 RepID=A0A7R9DG08_TIMPO|nr:unnamed protein product [Timema poppensis]
MTQFSSQNNILKEEEYQEIIDDMSVVRTPCSWSIRNSTRDYSLSIRNHVTVLTNELVRDFIQSKNSKENSLQHGAWVKQGREVMGEEFFTLFDQPPMPSLKIVALTRQGPHDNKSLPPQGSQEGKNLLPKGLQESQRVIIQE